jgi:hypothetical protein
MAVMKFAFSLVFIFMLVACGDEEQVCNVTRAFSGYASSPEDVDIDYDREYEYRYDGSTLVETKVYSFDDRSLISTIKYSYSTEGLLVKKIITFGGSSPDIHYYYDVTPNSRVATMHVISGTDTVSVTVFPFFYIEDPEDKVYHNKTNNESYKFQNGNMVELGYYEVMADDTVDTFFERYTFDGNLNYIETLAFREVIPNSFEWASISSDNNLIGAEYIGGGWKKLYTFEYDGDRLTQYRDLNTGHTIDFQYQCK